MNAQDKSQRLLSIDQEVIWETFPPPGLFSLIKHAAPLRVCWNTPHTLPRALKQKQNHRCCCLSHKDVVHLIHHMRSSTPTGNTGSAPAHLGHAHTSLPANQRLEHCPQTCKERLKVVRESESVWKRIPATSKEFFQG